MRVWLCVCVNEAGGQPMLFGMIELFSNDNIKIKIKNPLVLMV